MMNTVASVMSTGRFDDAIHRVRSYRESPLYPLLLDVTSDSMGQLNRRVAVAVG
jgi:hypothetical protein